MQLRFLCKIWFNNNLEMARISAILFSRHCHRAVFLLSRHCDVCHLFSSRQWCGVVTWWR